MQAFAMLRARWLPMVCVVLCAAGCQPDAATPAPNPAVTRAESVAKPPSFQPTAPVADSETSPTAFDPDLLHVTLFGDRLQIEQPGHGWPAYLDKSTMAFVRDGMKAFGAPAETAAPADCPAGDLRFLDYPNGVQLAFQDDTLVGYWVSEGARGVATSTGVHPGSARASLGGVQPVEASFGWVADLDGVIALLDEKQARVTDLYAGAACIYD
jgi:hypothetical protein